jgi:hypothetical protein
MTFNRAPIFGRCIRYATVILAVSCSGTLSQSGMQTVTISAEDNGMGQGTASECNTGNNQATMSFSC